MKLLLAGVLVLAVAGPSWTGFPAHDGDQPQIPLRRVWHDCPECPEMVLVLSGLLMMGSPADEAGRDEMEGPQRRVSIRPFAIGKFDVTRREWAAFVEATNRPVVRGCAWSGGPLRHRVDPEASWQSLKFPQDDTHPVVCVTWQDARDYAAWLSARTRQTYRLPSEAEWEFAARAHSTTPYPWGTTATHERANYGADECCSGRADGRDRWEFTSPVGSFPPNPLGLYDMHGNVLQWVQDCFAPYDGLPTDGSANEADVVLRLAGPLARLSGTRSCGYRMLRGGDWGNPPRMIRSAFRNFAPPPGAALDSYRSGGVGFRVVRVLR